MRKRERDLQVALAHGIHESSIARSLVCGRGEVCSEQVHKAQRVAGPRAVNTSAQEAVPLCGLLDALAEPDDEDIYMRPLWPR